eukprot:13685013-Alexandrium_andersonii.AAC.1
MFLGGPPAPPALACVSEALSALEFGDALKPPTAAAWPVRLRTLEGRGVPPLLDPAPACSEGAGSVSYTHLTLPTICSV